MGFISLLFGNKTLLIGVILAAMLGGLGIYIKILKSDIVKLKADITVLNSDLKISEQSVKDLQGALDTQNVAIDNLKSAADKRVASHKVELDAAKKVAITTKQKADQIMTLQKPVDKNTCNAANDLINSEIQNNVK